MSDYYEILGVERDATMGEIRDAYKKLCNSIHPDKGGGTDDFEELSEAYRVLINVEKRAKYDRGEDPTKPVVTKETKAKERLAMLFQQFIPKVTDSQDMIEVMRNAIQQGRVKMQKDMTNQEHSIDKCQKLLKRMHYKGDNSNMFEGVVNQMMEGNQRTIDNLSEELEITGIVLELLKDYEIEVNTPARSYAGYGALDGSSATSSILGFDI